jgi:Mn2+/Fe2+ NRAMP family transporter
MLKEWFKNIGPGTLVAAAFIGPGTVTLCTLAGVGFGYQLLWAMLLSTLATIFLQEMTARLGVFSQKGLSEVIRLQLSHPLIKWSMLILILSAIVIGNAAYEAGNISGGILGLETVFGTQELKINNQSFNLFSLIIGCIAFVILFIGNYKVLEKVLVGLVVLMSVSFIVTAVMTKPDFSALLKGLFIPQFPDESLFTIIGLIGTTVVPYNLFLHSSLVKEKWKTKSGLIWAKKDTIISIGLGGLVSMAIMISAVSITSQKITNASDLALSLEPLFGEYAKYFLAIGLFAAGITSAITAPLAAAYVAKGCLGWENNLKSKNFRAVWMFILGLGVVFSAVGFKPIDIIKFAQIANGILLPVIVGILLWIMNRKSVLGNQTNSLFQNSIGILIFVFTLFLGSKSILSVFDLL